MYMGVIEIIILMICSTVFVFGAMKIWYEIRQEKVLKIIRMLDEYFSKELRWANEDKKSDDYKAGLKKVITLYRYYFKEELQ